MKSKLISFIVFVSLIPLSNTAEAVTVGVPFGGKSTATIFCSCTATFLITMVNYVNNTTEKFMYSPLTTILYREFMFLRPDVYMIGTSVGIDVPCMQGVPPNCTPMEPAQSGAPIFMLGTSI